MFHATSVSDSFVHRVGDTDKGSYGVDGGRESEVTETPLTVSLGPSGRELPVCDTIDGLDTVTVASSGHSVSVSLVPSLSNPPKL